MALISVVKDDTGASSFTLHKDHLEHVIGQVDTGMPVAVVSVLGAFRSGKSFLLSWFLKVLNGADM